MLHRSVAECAARLDELGGAPEDDPDSPMGWLTMKDAGRLLSCSASTVRALVHEGRLPARKNAKGLWTVRRVDCVEYAHEHQLDAEDPQHHVPKPRPARKAPKNAPERPENGRKKVSVQKDRGKGENVKIDRSEAQNGRPAQTDGIPSGWMTVEAYAEAAGISRKEAVKRCQTRRVSCRSVDGRWLVSSDEAVIAKARAPEPDRSVGLEQLGSMSRLDILKALASGAFVGGMRV
jgi:excisionase family DNA binding protein